MEEHGIQNGGYFTNCPDYFSPSKRRTAVIGYDWRQCKFQPDCKK